MSIFKALESDISKVTFDGIKFSANADFRWANIKHCSFKGVDLRGADFTGANLSWCDFTGADLTGAIFKDTDLNNVIMTGAQFENGSLEAAKLVRCTLVKLNARNSDLRGADFGESECYNAVFKGSNCDGLKTDLAYGFKL